MKVSGVVTLVLFLLLGCMAVPLPVHARQDGEPLPVRLRKDFGFNAGVRIQGRFTMLVQSGNQYSFVEFYIDGNLVHTDQEAPFEYSFHTDELGLGTHTFEAAAYTGTGERIASGMIAREIVTAQEGWEVAARIAVPVIGISLLLTLIGTAGPLLLVRDRKRFELGMYGLAGGTVCRSCSLPFSRPFLAPNLLVGKLVRCPHCGKIAVLPAASREALQLAEERYRADHDEGAAVAEPGEDSLRRQIEDSRFMD